MRLSRVRSAVGAVARFNSRGPEGPYMGRRLALLLVASLLTVSWSITIPLGSAQVGGSEAGSILFEKKTFGSDEPLEATIGLWGLTVVGTMICTGQCMEPMTRVRLGRQRRSVQESSLSSPIRAPCRLNSANITSPMNR